VGGIRVEVGLVDHSKELLISPCNAFKVLPTIKVKQVVLPESEARVL